MVPGNSSQTQFQRVALPNAEVFEEEPLYVNAKQYRRILKRRQARAKLEAEGKIPKERPVSLRLVTCDLSKTSALLITPFALNSFPPVAEISARVPAPTRDEQNPRRGWPFPFWSSKEAKVSVNFVPR